MSINQNVVTTSIVQLVQNLEENISKILIKNQNASRNHKQIISKVVKYINNKLCLLETNDSEFHRLQLVKELKTRIMNEIMAKNKELLLKRKSQDNKSNNNDIDVINNVKKNLIDNMNFKQIEESILNDLNGGIDEIINEIEKSNKGHIKNHEQTKVQSMRQEPQLPTRMSPSESSLGWDDIFNTFNDSGNNNNNHAKKKKKKKKKKRTSTILFQAYSDDDEDEQKVDNRNFNDDEEEENDGASSDSSHFSFSRLPAYDTIPKISKDMYTSNPLDTRLKAWDSINEFSPGDLLHTQFWPVFKEGLLHGLIDPDSTLQNNYITLIQKLYKEAPPVLTGEIYLCLLSHLINQVRTIYPFIDVSSAINDGTKINLKQQKLKTVVQKFKILNKWQVDIPKHWLYYPDDLNDRIVIGTLNLLRLVKRPKKTTIEGEEKSFNGIEISAFDLIALVDPGAHWFLVWVGKAKPRDQLFNYMWQTGLLNELVWRLYHMGPIERNSSNPDNEDDTEIIPDKHNWQKLNDGVSKENEEGFIRVGHLRGLRLLNVMAILGRILPYAQGRRAFDDPRGVFLNASGAPPPRPLPSSIILPEHIETTPVRRTNNLVRVISKGATWCVVSKEDAEMVGQLSTSSTLICTIGWWNEFESNAIMAASSTLTEHVTMEDLLATYIQYLIFHVKRSKLKAPTMELLYLSQWQLHIDTLEELLCDIATYPKVFTYNHVHALVRVFVTLDSWTSVGKAISEILGKLFDHTTGLQLFEKPWMENGSNSSATLDLLVEYFCKKLPYLHRQEKRYQKMFVCLLESLSQLFDCSHTMKLLFSDNDITLCRMLILGIQNYPKDVKEHEMKRKAKIVNKAIGNKNSGDEVEEYHILTGLCSCIARLSLAPLGLNRLVIEYKVDIGKDVKNSFSASNYFVNKYLGGNVPELYDDRLALSEYVMAIASTPFGCKELEREGTVGMLYNELVKLLNDPKGIVSNPVMLHRPPDESPYMNSLLQIIKMVLSSPYLHTMNNNEDFRLLQDFVILRLLFGYESENTNRMAVNYYEWHLIGINIVQSMLSNLNNILYLEDQYQLTEKLIALQGESKLNAISDVSNSNFNIDDNLPDGVSFIPSGKHSPSISTEEIGANGKNSQTESNYIIDANTVGYQDLIATLTRIGGPSDRGLYFLPITRDLTTPYRVPIRLENNFAIYSGMQNGDTDTEKNHRVDNTLAANLIIAMSEIVKEDTSTSINFFLKRIFNNRSMKEALQKKMPLKLFCEKHAKEFRKYGGMWRDWINDSKEGTENSVGHEYFVENSAKRRELELLIQNSNAANRCITSLYQVGMSKLLEKSGNDNVNTLWISITAERSQTKILQSLHLKHAARLSLHYGMRCGLIPETDELDAIGDMTDDVYMFLRQTSSAQSVDWFSVVIYLVCSPSLDIIENVRQKDSITMLKNISKIPHSVFLWPSYSRLFTSTEEETTSICFISHLVIYILEKENIEVVSAVRVNGLSLHAILSTWISQCFVNYLDWADILHYINLSLFVGMDYQVYFIVTLLDYLKESIITQTWRFIMTEVLIQNPLYTSFDVLSAYPKMQRLEKKYGAFIMKEMTKMLKRY